MESWSEVVSLKSCDHLLSGDLRSLHGFRSLKLSLLPVTVVLKRSGSKRLKRFNVTRKRNWKTGIPYGGAQTDPLKILSFRFSIFIFQKKLLLKFILRLFLFPRVQCETSFCLETSELRRVLVGYLKLHHELSRSPKPLWCFAREPGTREK